MTLNPAALVARSIRMGAIVLAISLSPPLVAQEDAYAAYERALVMFERDELETSLLELKQALARSPNLLPGQILLARIYLRLGEGAAARESLLKTRRLGGDPAIIEPLMVEALLLQRDFKRLAAREIPETLAVEVRAELLVARSTAQVELGDEIAAEASLDAAARLAPSAAAPRIGLAKLALLNGELETAEVRASALVRLAPDDADAWYVHGSVKHTRGDLEQAMVSYSRALQVDGGHYDARVARAGVLLDQARYGKAATDISLLRSRFPRDPRAAYLDAVRHAKQGRMVTARAALKRAAALFEEMPSDVIRQSPQLELLAGITNYELEAFEQAQLHLNHYIERRPREAGPRKILGAIMVAQGRTEEAVLMLESALRLAPRDTRLMALLGVAYMQSGRHDLATPYLDKALAGGDDSPQLRAQLAMSRIAEGASAQGLEELAAIFEQDTKANAGTGIALAVAYLQANRDADALTVSEQLVAVLPRHLTALNLLAVAQQRTGQQEQAQLTYQRILSIDPTFTPADVNLATLEAASGDIDAATARLEGVLEREPGSAQTMVELARVDERAGRIASALRWMNKARDSNPKNISVLMALIDLQLRIGEPSKALEVARAAENVAPQDLRVLAALGRTNVAVDRADVAKAIYQRMVLIAGFDADELNEIAQLQTAAGAGDDAIYSLRKALQGDPGNATSRALLIEAELLHGDRQQALALARGLLEDNPSSAASHALLGDTLTGVAKHDQAAASYQRALELAPSTAYVLALNGALQRAGHGQQAHSLLNEWLDRHPGDGRSRMALAEGYLANGELELAREHYEAVLDIAPDTAQVLNNLAYILDRQGDPAALDLARRAHAAAPGDPAIADTLGWMLVRRGAPAEGLRYLRDAHSRISGSAEIGYHVSVALAALDRNEEALRALRRAIDSGAPFEGREDAQALLKKLQRQ